MRDLRIARPEVTGNPFTTTTLIQATCGRASTIAVSRYEGRRGGAPRKGIRWMYLAVVVMTIALCSSTGLAQLGDPTAVYDPATNQLKVFVHDAAGNLYDKYWTGSAWKWQSQGNPGISLGYVGTAMYDPKSPNPLIVFAVDSGGWLWDKYLNGATSKWVWEGQGAPSGTTIYNSSAFYDPGTNSTIDFVFGSNGHLFDKYWSGSSWVWEDQGTPPGTSVAFVGGAVYDPKSSNSAIVFLVGSNGHLFDKYWNGSGWFWEDQGTPPGTTAYERPAVVYQPTGHPLVVFVNGINGHLFDIYWNGSKWVWEDQGTSTSGGFPTGPSALYDPASSNSLVVFAVGNDGHLYDKYFDGSTGTWVWEDQGIPPGDVGVNWLYRPNVIYDPASPNPLVVFVIGTKTGDLFDKYWDPSAGKWEWESQGHP